MSVELSGFVMLYRRFREWEWYTDNNTKAVFLELLLTANFKDGNFRGEPVPRGSVVTSIHHLAVALKLSDMQVRTALKHLQSTGEITVKATSKFSVITVNNYAKYQDCDTQKSKQSTSRKQATSKQGTVKQHSTDNNVIIQQGNKEISGGVCPTDTHTPLQKSEKLAALPTVPPGKGEPAVPPEKLKFSELRFYCESKGKSVYDADDEWRKRDGIFSDRVIEQIRRWNQQNGYNL